MEGEEDLVDMDDIFKDLFGGSSFGGGSSFMSFEMDDFDDFPSMLEGSSSDAKSFKKIFRDLGRGYKMPGGHKQSTNKGRSRKNKPKGGSKGFGNEDDAMEDMMMAMMMGDLGMGMGGKIRRRRHGQNDDNHDNWGHEFRRRKDKIKGKGQ
jgi:hypothetical protein